MDVTAEWSGKCNGYYWDMKPYLLAIKGRWPSNRMTVQIHYTSLKFDSNSFQCHAEWRVYNFIFWHVIHCARKSHPGRQCLKGIHPTGCLAFGTDDYFNVLNADLWKGHLYLELILSALLKQWLPKISWKSAFDVVENVRNIQFKKQMFLVIKYALFLRLISSSTSYHTTYWRNVNDGISLVLLFILCDIQMDESWIPGVSYLIY